MKQKCLLIASVLLMLFAFLGQVQATTIDLDYGDDRYIGYIHQYSGDDASETSLAGYLNYLITIGVDAGVFEYGDLSYTPVVDPDASGLDTPLFDRFDSALDTSGLADADASDSAKIDSSLNTFLFNQTISWDYVVGKYDGPNAGWLVWDISDVTFVDGDTLVLPSDWTPEDPTNPDPDRYGLSNYTFYNGGNGGGGGGDPIPEPATFMLFGIGLLGIARVSRRKK